MEKQLFLEIGPVLWFNMVTVGTKIHICGYTLSDRTVETKEGKITKIDDNGNIYGTWGPEAITVNTVFYGIQ